MHARRPRWGRLVDPKFRRHPTRYIAQCGIATVTILIVLLLLDAMHQTVLIASLGASAFIAFTMPHVNASKRRFLIGGYIVGTAVGCAWATVASVVALAGIWSSPAPLLIVCGALATGSAILAMVITQTEHPPAAALALGYVLNEWDLLTILVILAGILAISTVKETCKPLLIDLL